MGENVGMIEGMYVGNIEGRLVGEVGIDVGRDEGELDGLVVGELDGCDEGLGRCAKLIRLDLKGSKVGSCMACKLACKFENKKKHNAPRNTRQ